MVSLLDASSHHEMSSHSAMIIANTCAAELASSKMAGSLQDVGKAVSASVSHLVAKYKIPVT